MGKAIPHPRRYANPDRRNPASCVIAACKQAGLAEPESCFAALNQRAAIVSMGYATTTQELRMLEIRATRRQLPCTAPASPRSPVLMSGSIPYFDGGDIRDKSAAGLVFGNNDPSKTSRAERLSACGIRNHDLTAAKKRIKLARAKY